MSSTTSTMWPRMVRTSLPMYGIPLEMEAAHGSSAGKALIGLREANAAHERRRVALLEITEAVLLAEVAAIDRETARSG